MSKLLIILICLCSLSASSQPASVRFQETFEYSRYFPLSGTAINKVHGIENAVPNDTANGGLYDSTLIRVSGPYAPFRGNKYVHYQLKKGWPLVGSAQRYRSEVVIFKPDEDPQFADLMPNVWYSFAILFPIVGMESDFTSRDLINQWFEDANSDNTIKVDGGKVYFEATPNLGTTTKLRFDLFGQTITVPQSNNVSAMVPIPKGVWHEFVFHIIHSTTNGLVDIWRDGQWIHHITGRTMHFGYPKWKIGIYKSDFVESIYDSRVLYFDNIRVGDSTATLQDMMSQTNANIPPTARAGNDQTITLPTSSVNLNGSASTDGDGTISSYAWTKISGPATYTITSPSTATTSVTGLVAGIYQFQLTVTDNNSAANSDVVQVTVNTPPNTPPTANAGADQSITLPTSTTTLVGSGNDPDGTITGYAWAKISGPTGGTITSPTSATTGITALQAGTYVYRLTVTDNLGGTGSDLMQVVVIPAPNTPPNANAGIDQTITLPTNTATLDGSGSSDPDGTIAGYAWVKISGPTGGSITSPASVSTGITGLTQGIYVYQLTVTDNNSATASDLITITVNPAIPPPNEPPVADAGANQTITLPVNTATLDGTGSTDPDGTITDYLWIKTSGPATGSITSPTSATTGLTSLVQGVYTFQLTVTDNNGDTGTASTQITVLPCIRNAPTVNAGIDQSKTLPVNTATIVGTATPNNCASISSTLWSKISGPTGGTITTASSLTTGITALQAGTYIFKLLATDNNNDTASDVMQIVVYPKIPVLPIVSAGADTTITIPVNQVTLTGTASDPDGTVTVQWVKVSGPNIYQIIDDTTLTPTMANLAGGTYVFRIIGTDDDGNIATNDMTLTVINNFPVNTRTHAPRPRKVRNAIGGIIQ